MTCPDSTFNQTYLNDTGVCRCDDGYVVGASGSCEEEVACGDGFYNDGNNQCL